MLNTGSKRPGLNLHDQLLVAVCLIIIWGALVYYFYALNWPGLIAVLILSFLSFLFLYSLLATPHEPDPPEPAAWSGGRSQLIWLLAYLWLFLALVFLLWAARSDQALISPWETVSPMFLGIYATATALLALVVTRETLGRGWKITFLSAHYLISFTVAIIVYRIGYGFDPFIHEATMELIAEQGFVLPKTPYYLGQYGLVVTLAKMSGLSIALLNKLLVPLAAALLLPLALSRYLSFQKHFDTSDDIRWLTILFLPVIGYLPFIVTTPQNLSYLFLILAVLAGSHRNGLKMALLLAVATTAIHPLTGLPALAWCAFLIWQRYRNRLQIRTAKLLGVLIFLGAAFILPIAFMAAAGGRLSLDAGLYLENLRASFSGFTMAGSEDWKLNFAYFLAGNRGLILGILILSCIVYAYRRGQKYAGLLVIETALLVAYLVSRSLKFDALIDYEQFDYAGRIPVLMVIFSLPFLLYAGQAAIKKIRREPKLRQIIWLVFAAGVMTVSLYISYPRFDRYFNSRGYSTGAADIAAVRSIMAEASNPYIVLANQQVSAAALRELGFGHYYDTAVGPLYIYPIPTGSPLYKYYLDMVYEKPSRETMEQAGALAGVQQGYLVVNKYWYQSGQIINNAKLTADRFWDIDGQVYIFEYRF